MTSMGLFSSRQHEAKFRELLLEILGHDEYLVEHKPERLARLKEFTTDARR